MARYELDREYYYRISQYNELFEAESLTNAELAKTARVSFDLLKMLRHKQVSETRKSNFQTMCNEGISNFELFKNQRLMDELLNSLDIAYFQDRDASYYDFKVYSETVFTCTGAKRVADKIVLPADIRKASAFYLSHELCHILKERNDSECKNQNNYHEVIPILMEMIFAYVYDSESFDVIISNRCRMMKIAAREFIELYKEYISITDEDVKETYLMALNEKGKYLHSFYYVLCLFEVYMNDEKGFIDTSMNNKEYILSRIANVLLCNESTKDFLDDMSFKFTNIDALYESGFDRLNDISFSI